MLERTGVMLTPGSALDLESYLRIGFANDEAILREGLSQMSRFLGRETGMTRRAAASR